MKNYTACKDLIGLLIGLFIGLFIGLLIGLFYFQSTRNVMLETWSIYESDWRMVLPHHFVVPLEQVALATNRTHP